MAIILFVDDDPLTLKTLTKAVDILGHHAILAGSGKEALSIAEEQSPDIIITDLMLPDMNGINLVKQLNKKDTTDNIPIYILSASPELDAVDHAHKAGAVAYLNKPIRIQTLLDIIDEQSPD